MRKMDQEYDLENICRLCLERTINTDLYSVNSDLCGSTAAEILMSFVPELYLGVTRSPMICLECYKLLENFQKFKKMCIDSEYKIGVYLRETKCTATVVKLSKILEFWERKKLTQKVEDIIQKTQKEIEIEKQQPKKVIVKPSVKPKPKAPKVLRLKRPGTQIPPHSNPYFVQIQPKNVQIQPKNVQIQPKNNLVMDELSLKNLLTSCSNTDYSIAQKNETFTTPIIIGSNVLKMSEVISDSPTSKNIPPQIENKKFEIGSKINDSFQEVELSKPNGSCTITQNDSSVKNDSAVKSVEKEIPLFLTPNLRNLRFCPETGTFKNSNGEAFDCFGKPVDVSKAIEILPDPTPPKQPVLNPQVDLEEPAPVYIYKGNNVESKDPNILEESKNAFSFSISDVKSLQGETIESIRYVVPTNHNIDGRKVFILKENDIKGLKGFTSIASMTASPAKVTGNVATTSVAATTATPTHEDEDVIDIKDEPLEIDENELAVNLFPSDGETTRSASETSFYENLARETGINSLLATIPETDTLYDMPEYVHINNVSFEDLNKLKEESEQFTQSMLQEQMVRNPAALKAQGGVSRPFHRNKPAVPRHPAKRRLKLVQVEQETKSPPQILIPTSASSNKRGINHRDLLPKNNVVLFTNFTENGDYINDHDYLINPYIRNNMVRVIYQGSGEYSTTCSCQVCGDTHDGDVHIEHMKTHKSTCDLCQIDFKNVFILNLHVKRHLGRCAMCGEVDLPYAELLNHKLKHQVKKRSESDSDEEEACIYDSATNSFKTPSSMTRSLLESLKTDTTTNTDSPKIKGKVKRGRKRLSKASPSDVKSPQIDQNVPESEKEVPQSDKEAPESDEKSSISSADANETKTDTKDDEKLSICSAKRFKECDDSSDSSEVVKGNTDDKAPTNYRVLRSYLRNPAQRTDNIGLLDGLP